MVRLTNRAMGVIGDTSLQPFSNSARQHLKLALVCVKGTPAYLLREETVRQLRLEDIIRWFGIATIADIARLQSQIDEANRRFQIEMDALRERHDKTTNGFANYKRKTDEELTGF